MTTRTLIYILISTVTLIFSTAFFSTFDYPKVLCVYLFTVLVLVSWVSSRNHIYLPITNRFVLSVLIFIFISGISTLTAVSPLVSFKGAFCKYTGYGLTLSCVYLFFVIITNFNTHHIKQLLNVIVYTGIATCLFAFYQCYIHDVHNWLHLHFGGHWFSTFGNPNFYSAFLSMIIPLAIYKTINNKWYGFAVVLFIYSLFQTQCKGGVIALFISTGYMIFMLRKQVFVNKKVIGISIVIFIVIIFIGIKSSTFSRFNIKSMVTDKRISLYKSGILIIKDYPFLGVGPDNIRSVYCKYAFPPPNVIEKKCDPLVIDNRGEMKMIWGHDRRFGAQTMMHQDLIDTACNIGIVGLIAYLFMLYSFFRMVWIAGKDPLVIALSCSVMAYVVQNQFSFGIVPLIVLWWYLMAMGFVVCKEVRK